MSDACLSPEKAKTALPSAELRVLVDKLPEGGRPLLKNNYFIGSASNMHVFLEG